MEYVIAVLLALMVRELYAWVPNLSTWLLRRAAFRVCVEERERCLEEWRAAIADFPNSLVALLHAMSIFCGSATYKITSDYFKSKIELFDVDFQTVMSSHRKQAIDFKANIVGHHNRASKRSTKINTISADEQRKSWETANKSSKIQYDDTFLEIQDCMLKFVNAFQKADEVLDKPIHIMSIRLAKIEEIEKRILRHRDQIGRLIERWRPNVPRIQAIEQQMHEDFNNIKEIIADDVVEDEVLAQAELYRIGAHKQTKRLELLFKRYVHLVRKENKRPLPHMAKKELK